MSAAAKRALGAPFIFESTKYRMGKSGSNEKESADIGWICNGCAILFYMTEEKRNPEDGSDDLGHRVRGTISHNVEQASTWIRRWRGNNATFNGQNRHSSCRVKLADCKHVVVISVVSHNPIAKYHADHARSMGVSMCATLPQSAVERLVDIGGSSLDLIELLDALRTGGSTLTEDEALEKVDGIMAAAIRGSGLPEGNDPQETLDFLGTINGIASVRHGEPADEPMPLGLIEEGQLMSLLNDLPLRALIMLAAYVAKEISGVRQAQAGQARKSYVLFPLPLSRYRVLVGVCEDASAAVAGKLFSRHFAKECAEKPYDPPMLLTYIVSTRGVLPAILSERRHSKSAIEHLLDEISCDEGRKD